MLKMSNKIFSVKGIRRLLPNAVLLNFISHTNIYMCYRCVRISILFPLIEKHLGSLGRCWRLGGMDQRRARTSRAPSADDKEIIHFRTSSELTIANPPHDA